MKEKDRPMIGDDGEVRELTAREISRMRPAKDVLPPDLYEFLVNASKKRRGERGKQKNPVKIRVSIRFNPEVVRYFRSTGSGWQSRMNQILQDHVNGNAK